MPQKPLFLEIKSTTKLAIPIIIAQLGVVLMGVSDNIIVGRLLDKIALGSAGIANSVAFLLASLAVGGMSVVAPLVSKNVSESNSKSIKSLFGSVLWVCVVYSAVLTFFGILAYNYFYLLDQPKSINQFAPNFLLILIASNIPLIFFLGVKQFADGLSQPKIEMTITVIGLILNAVLNIIFIKGLVFKPMGIYGSALATLITRSLMFLSIFLYLRFSGKFSLYFRRFSMNFKRDEIQLILKRSIPAGFQIFFEIGAFSMAVIMMGWISETALAAHQIAINIASVTYMMASGFAYAAAIRVGQAWGNRSISGIKLAGYAAYALVFGFMFLAMVFILVFDKFLLSGYINDAEVIKQALPLLTIAAFFQLSDGIQVVGLGVLRGLGDVKIPTIITFAAYWLIALPLGYFLGFRLNLKADGIWYGLFVGLSFSAVFLYSRFKNQIKIANLEKRFAKK